MNARAWMMAALLTSAICTGCGGGHYWHEVRLKFDLGGDAKPKRPINVGLVASLMSSENTDTMRTYTTDTNGVVRIAYRSFSGTWVWQKRPAALSFQIFVPSVSTNGYFDFYLDESSKLPTRGVTAKTVPVRASYSEFTTWYKGSRPIHTLRAKVIPSGSGGYRVEMDLPIKTLGHAVTSEFVPRKSRVKTSR